MILPLTLRGWLPRLDVIQLPVIDAQMLFDVVHRKKTLQVVLMVGSWKELKTLLLPWFDGLAAVLKNVEEDGVWPEGLLDADIDMIPKSDGDATPLGQRPPMCSPCCL